MTKIEQRLKKLEQELRETQKRLRIVEGDLRWLREVSGETLEFVHSRKFILWDKDRYIRAELAVVKNKVTLTTHSKDGKVTGTITF